jgi:hypothetical protein
LSLKLEGSRLPVQGRLQQQRRQPQPFAESDLFEDIKNMNVVIITITIIIAISPPPPPPPPPHLLQHLLYIRSHCIFSL